MIRFGVHCSLRKGLPGALEEAKNIECEAMQIFTRSPRMWRMTMPPEGDIRELKASRNRSGIAPLVVHTPYLPNIATSKQKLYAMSLKALIDDLTVSDILRADYLVIHPGAYSETATRETGIKKVVDAVNKAFEESAGDVSLLLENTAGGGRRMGSAFQEIAAMIDGIKNKKRIGVCFDTAHAFAAGYDISCAKGIDKALSEFDSLIGLKYLKCVHFNDSMAPLSSRRDRHEHIAKGYIGAEGFKYFIERVKDIAEAGILETPKDSETADLENLSKLKKWRKQKSPLKA